jgi:hypothetical protein
MRKVSPFTVTVQVVQEGQEYTVEARVTGYYPAFPGRGLSGPADNAEPPEAAEAEYEVVKVTDSEDREVSIELDDNNLWIISDAAVQECEEKEQEARDVALEAKADERREEGP